MRVWVFHRGALGDSVLLWPRLRARARRGDEVTLVTDGSKGLLAASELGIRSVDIEQRRFSRLWVEDAEVEPQPDVDIVVSCLTTPNHESGRVLEANMARMFPHAIVETHAPPRGGMEAIFFDRDEPLSRAEGRVNPTGPVVCHAGAGSAHKRWPLKRWIELRAVVGCEVRLIAGEVERAQWFERERDAFASTGGVFIDDLFALRDVIKGAAAFIGADSGPTHLAAQLGVPTLAIFGPTDTVEWSPMGPWVTVMASLTPRPMEAVSVSEVAEDIQRLLAEVSP